MNIKTKAVVYFLSIMLMSTSTIAQISQQTSENINSSEVPSYKWEVGIDALSLTNRAKDAFGFIVKRNYQASSGRKALRLKFLPRLVNSPGTGGTARENNSSINIAVGYEWQKMYNNFSVLYGVEPFFQYNIIKVTSLSTGTVSFSQTDTKVGISGFIGGRYYINKHLSLTVETHLIYQYYNANGDNNTASSFGNYNQVFINPLHAFYLGYHF